VLTAEEDLSSYLAYESFAGEVLAIFMGFTFTAITLLLTLLPDPSQILAQVTLFFLALVFYLFQFIVFFAIYYLMYCVRGVPPEARGRRSLGLLLFSGFSLWGLVIVLMFLLWNLTYLALASGTVYALFTILAFIYIWKPALELMSKLRSQK